MNKDVLISLIRRRFGDTKQERDEIRVNCPFCALRGFIPNTTKKLYINLSKGKYHCFRCEISGSSADLFPQLSAVSAATEKILTEKKELEQLPELYELSGLRYPANDWVVDFASKKGFLLTELNNVYFCYNYKKGDYSFGPRLVFPIYQFGSYRGFQARTVFDNTDPKYIGATGMQKSTLLYNYDAAFAQKERLVITEGFFDCLRVGGTGIATLGKEVSDEQIRLIKLGEFSEVIVFLDRDAQKEAKEVAKKLSICFKTYTCIPKEKDPGEMRQEDIEFWLKTRKVRVY